LYLKNGGKESRQCLSRIAKRRRGIWQRRFWEHQIRDETDLQNHVDYIHYNPLKHELVEKVEDWPWSTYHRYIKEHKYTKDRWNQVRKEIEKMNVYE
jgi:putative transposase